MIDSDGIVLGYLGKPTEDGKRCRYLGEKNNGPYGKYTLHRTGSALHGAGSRRRSPLTRGQAPGLRDLQGLFSRSGSVFGEAGHVAVRIFGELNGA